MSAQTSQNSQPTAQSQDQENVIERLMDMLKSHNWEQVKLIDQPMHEKYFVVKVVDEKGRSWKFVVSELEYPLQTGSFIVLKIRTENFPVKFLEWLDDVEENQYRFAVSLELQTIGEPPSPEEVDYNNVAGVAIIRDPRFKAEVDNESVYGGWIYRFNGASEIPLYFLYQE